MALSITYGENVHTLMGELNSNQVFDIFAFLRLKMSHDEIMSIRLSDLAGADTAIKRLIGLMKEEASRQRKTLHVITGRSGHISEGPEAVNHWLQNRAA